MAPIFFFLHNHGHNPELPVYTAPRAGQITNVMVQASGPLGADVWFHLVHRTKRARAWRTGMRFMLGQGCDGAQIRVNPPIPLGIGSRLALESEDQATPRRRRDITLRLV